MNSEKTIQDLSFAFSTIIHSWLTVDEINKVVILNDTPDYKGCCATHNFCDANMAMVEAFDIVFNRELSTNKLGDMLFFNKAWNLSKINNFSIVL